MLGKSFTTRLLTQHSNFFLYCQKIKLKRNQYSSVVLCVAQTGLPRAMQLKTKGWTTPWFIAVLRVVMIQRMCTGEG